MQRRRRFRRAGIPSNAALSLFGKEIREAHLQALLGGTSRSSAPSSATDVLLSSLVYNISVTETEDPPKPAVVVVEQPVKSSSLSQQPKTRQFFALLCSTIYCLLYVVISVCISICEKL